MSVYLHGMHPAGMAAAGIGVQLMRALYVDTFDQIAGAPGSGKTALALGIAQELGTKARLRVAAVQGALRRTVLHKPGEAQVVGRCTTV